MARRATWSLRVLPDFLIIGGQRCGTTSLAAYLREHPAIVPAFTKEVHYFNLNYYKGLGWYRARFATRLACDLRARAIGRRPITGEATADYFTHPGCPARVAATLPHVRLILLLRDPVNRSYSHYQQKLRSGREWLSFPEAIEREPERLAGERERLERDPCYRGLRYQLYSYVTRGHYRDWIDEWLRYFPRERLLVLRSESFFADPGETLRRIADFLEIDAPADWLSRPRRAYGAHEYPDMPAETRERLRAYFAPHNRRLYEFLGEDWGWGG